MNWKQKICLWVGIAVIVAMGIFPPVYHHTVFSWSNGPTVRPPKYEFLLTATGSAIEYSKLFVQWAIIAVITGGLIYTFKDKKDEKVEDEQKQQVNRVSDGWR